MILITLNNFIEAVAAKLIAVWPDRHVYVNQIPKDADGNFFVGIIEATQEKKLDRRRRRNQQFEVLYMLSSDDSLLFNEWAETMFDEFETISVKEMTVDKYGRPVETIRGIRLTNQTARHDDEQHVYQFLFDADFYFVIREEPALRMYYLFQNNEIKSVVNPDEPGEEDGGGWVPPDDPFPPVE